MADVRAIVGEEEPSSSPPRATLEHARRLGVGLRKGVERAERAIRAVVLDALQLAEEIAPIEGFQRM